MHSLLLTLFLSALLVISYCDEQLVGGKTDIEATDPIVQQMARFAVSEMGTEYSYISVRKAQTQVVNGLIYHMDVLVNRIKTGENTVKQLECEVQVHSKNWMGFLKLNKFKCTNTE